MPAILNFYTKIDASITIAAIQKILAKSGAIAVLIEFDGIRQNRSPSTHLTAGACTDA